MNLFQNPSINDLHSLLKSAPEGKEVHDLVLDYDGEVLIDPQLEHPDLDLSKFKFRVRLTEFSKRMVTRGSTNTKYLFTKLLQAWNSNTDFSRHSLA